MGARHKLALFSLFCYPRGLLAECEDLGNPQRGEECCPPNCNHRNRPLCKTIKVQSEASDTLTSLPKTDTPELSCTHLSQVSQVTQSEAPSPQSLFLQKPSRSSWLSNCFPSYSVSAATESRLLGSGRQVINLELDLRP